MKGNSGSGKARGSKPVIASASEAIQLSGGATESWIASSQGLLAMTLKRQDSAFSRRNASEVCMNSSSLGNQRAQETPGAQCTRSLACSYETKHTSVVTTGSPDHPGVSCTMVLRLPSCSPRRTKPASHRRHRHWVSRTTRLLRPQQCRSSCSTAASHRIPPRVRDDRASAPLWNGTDVDIN